jgi:hypothetical protein
MEMFQKAASVAVPAALTALMFVSLGIAQTQQAPAAATTATATAPAPAVRSDQAGPGAGGRGGMNFDPSQIQQMLDENSRQTLGASPDEWKVLGPKFNKVQTLARSISGGGLGMFGIATGGMGRMGGAGGMGGPMGGAMGRGLTALMGEPTALDKVRDNIYTALSNNSSPADVQAAIKAFRETRDKMRKDLSEAQADLKKVCTVQQEATLIAMGLLD